MQFFVANNPSLLRPCISCNEITCTKWKNILAYFETQKTLDTRKRTLWNVIVRKG